MQVQRNRCPNCPKFFCFPVQYPGGQCYVVCPHCFVLYNLMEVKLLESYFEDLIHSRQNASILHKGKISTKMSHSLVSAAQEFQFVGPPEPNAVVLLLASSRSPFPQAVYFQGSYYLIVQPAVRRLFAAAISLIGGLSLLVVGLSLVPVFIGAIFAAACFWRLTILPKVKGTTRKKLKAEQALFQMCHDWQQFLQEAHETQNRFSRLAERQEAVLKNMLHTPEQYPTHIELYERSVKAVKDYLNLCEHVIEQHEAAIRVALLQIKTSKLGVELSANFVNPRIEFRLDLLQEQLQNNLPPKLADYGSNDDHPTC